MKSELERRLKLTIVSNYYYPDVASIANLYRQLAEYLAREMDVTVLCAVPSYLGAIPEAYRGRRYFCSRENGVRMIRIGVPAFDKTRKKQRIKSLFFYLLRAVGACRLLGKQDVILAVSQPPVFGGFIGWWLKKRTGGKFIYNIQDFNPEQIECAGFSKSPLILKTLKALDCSFCRAADSIITVSEDMRKTLYSRLGGSVPENHVINNWVDTERIVGVPKAANPLLKKYGLRGQDFLVVYAGNIGIMQNLETFLRAADMLKGRPDIRFVFIGAGARLSALRRLADELQLDNVLFAPYEPIENIDLIYSLGDLEIVSIGKNVTKCGMPSKTWNILSCASPIICQVDPDSELNRLILSHKLGRTAPPGDAELLAKEILALYGDGPLRAEMGANARKLAVEAFDFKVSAARYRDVILALASPRA